MGTQEPEGVTDALLTEIKTDLGAEEVVFIVKNVLLGVNNETVGYVDQQINLCKKLTGQDNFVVQSNYSVCVR